MKIRDGRPKLARTAALGLAAIALMLPTSARAHDTGADIALIDSGVVFVIAAGATDTRDTPDPADDRVGDFSSRSAYRSPDVVAPGTRMVSLRVPGSMLDDHDLGPGNSEWAGRRWSGAAWIPD